MKFKITRNGFVESLKTVQNIVPARSSLPVLQNVLLKAEGGRLELTASDIDMTVRTSAECETVEPGASTLPVKMLFSTMSKAPEGVVEVEIDENENATILAGSARFNLSGLPAKEYPALPGLDSAKTLETDCLSLKEMLRKTAFAAAADDTRRPLMGVLMRFRAGKFTMAATDGRRLALVEKEMEIADGEETDMVVPSRAALELERALAAVPAGGEGDDRVVIRAAGNQAAFAFGKTEVFSKLIEEAYPNYEQVIPRDLPNKATIDRALLANALERTSIVSVAASISTKFVFDNGVLNVSATSLDHGSAKDEVPIKYSGERLEVNFNPVYVLDALKSIDDDEVVFELKDGHHPGVLRCSIPYIYVIMPLHIS